MPRVHAEDGRCQLFDTGPQTLGVRGDIRRPERRGLTPAVQAAIGCNPYDSGIEGLEYAIGERMAWFEPEERKFTGEWDEPTPVGN